MGVPLYIVGTTFDQVMQALTLATDAHDPFNFFSFCGSNSFRFSAVVPIEKRGAARSLVIAEKGGAAAPYYANELRERLRQAGLETTITADLDEAIELSQSDSVSVRESIPLTRAQWAVLSRIAAETGSLAERGDNARKPSWRTLLRRIADGELRIIGAE